MTQVSTSGPKPGLTAAPPPAALRPASVALAPASASFPRSQTRRREPRGIDGRFSCACALGSESRPAFLHAPARARAPALLLIEQYLLLAVREGGSSEPRPAGRVRDLAPALSAAKALNK